jgi:hypothetical protein
VYGTSQSAQELKAFQVNKSFTRVIWTFLQSLSVSSDENVFYLNFDSITKQLPLTRKLEHLHGCNVKVKTNKNSINSSQSTF